jgi:hypothetical protein
MIALRRGQLKSSCPHPKISPKQTGLSSKHLKINFSVAALMLAKTGASTPVFPALARLVPSVDLSCCQYYLPMAFLEATPVPKAAKRTIKQ